MEIFPEIGPRKNFLVRQIRREVSLPCPPPPKETNYFFHTTAIDYVNSCTAHYFLRHQLYTGLCKPSNFYYYYYHHHHHHNHHHHHHHHLHHHHHHHHHHHTVS